MDSRRLVGDGSADPVLASVERTLEFLRSELEVVDLVSPAVELYGAFIEALLKVYPELARSEAAPPGA